MKARSFFLVLALAQCCFGQTDTNLVGIGDWSQPVNDRDHWVRGRLVIYDDKVQSAANHARVYLELQHVFQGGWSNPLEVYFDVGRDLRFELLDAFGKPLPQEPVVIRGMMPPPRWVTLPCDSTIRLRADIYTLGPQSKPDGLEVFAPGGCWIIRRNTRNDVFLSASFTSTTNHPSPLKYFVWQGTLSLPKVEIPAKIP